MSTQRICACDKCSTALGAIVERIHPILGPARWQWMEGLQHPNKAWICALILARLPRLKALELYAKLHSSCNTCIHCMSLPGGNFKPTRSGPEGDVLENSRLVSALALTQLQELTLSIGLNGLYVAKHPSLKTLTLDYSKRSPFVQVTKECFVNVDTLKIQRLKADFANDWKRSAGYTPKINRLIASLPNIRTLEFTSGDAAKHCSIPLSVDKVIIWSEQNIITNPPLKKFVASDAQIDAIRWGRQFLRDLPSGSALRSIDMHWPEKSEVHECWHGYEHLVMKTGVKVVLWQNDETWRMFGPLGMD